MDHLEQHLFALELIVSLRLAMDPPAVRRQLAESIQADLEDADPVERLIRERALALVGG